MSQILDLLMNQPIAGLMLLLAIILAISLHEAAHAYSAYWLGDHTPKVQGRLTINPLKHLDPLGTLLIVLIGFGWGRPVEFNPYNLKHAKRDIALVALAGPTTNILLAVVSSLLFNLNVFYFLPGELSSVLNIFLLQFGILNITLAVFNMLPIEPLDGFKVLGGILPNHLARQWYETRQYGFIVLLVLFITDSIGRIIVPISQLLFGIIFQGQI